MNIDYAIKDHPTDINGINTDVKNAARSITLDTIRTSGSYCSTGYRAGKNIERTAANKVVGGPRDGRLTNSPIRIVDDAENLWDQNGDVLGNVTDRFWMHMLQIYMLMMMMLLLQIWCYYRSNYQSFYTALNARTTGKITLKDTDFEWKCTVQELINMIGNYTANQYNNLHIHDKATNIFEYNAGTSKWDLKLDVQKIMDADNDIKITIKDDTRGGTHAHYNARQLDTLFGFRGAGKTLGFTGQKTSAATKFKISKVALETTDQALHGSVAEIANALNGFTKDADADGFFQYNGAITFRDNISNITNGTPNDDKNQIPDDKYRGTHTVGVCSPSFHIL